MSLDRHRTGALPDVASQQLDLVFGLDCTGSMASYISNAQQNIHRIVDTIKRKSASSIQIGLVKYRDHPPEDHTFVTEVFRLTSSVSTMKAKLDECKADGGGDRPEAVADALHGMLRMSWRPTATKVCVLVADAPPHGLIKHGDHFPDGCPAKHDPMQIARSMAGKGITLYVVGCEPSVHDCSEFYRTLAHLTSGQYLPLGNAANLAEAIIGGSQEEISLNRLMPTVEWLVADEVQRSGRVPDDEQLVDSVHEKLSKSGVSVVKLLKDSAELPGASAQVKAYSKMGTMADVSTAITRAGRASGGAYAASGSRESFEVEEGVVTRAQVSRMVTRTQAMRKSDG